MKRGSIRISIAASCSRNSPKDLAVLDAAAKKADWDTPPPPGVFRGIALSRACGTYCAQVVEISIERGRLRVRRVVSAIDPGYAVNPLSIEMQTQGAVVYALTAALYGEITIKNGGTEQSNFDGYEMLRWPTRRRSRPWWCRAAVSGAASASRRCRRSRRLCATPSLPPPASASARCR